MLQNFDNQGFGFRAKLIGVFTVVVFLSTCLHGQSNPVPDSKSGWKKVRISGEHAHVSFQRRGLSSPDYIAVKYYDRTPLVDGDLRSWVQKRLSLGKAPLDGKWTGPIKQFDRMTRNLYIAEREFTVAGTKHSIGVAAVCVDKLNVRMAAIITSLTSEAKKHSLQAAQIQAPILKLEIAAAKAEKRGLALEKSPPKVKGLKTGLKIKPGRYTGATVAKKDGKAETRFDIVLFDTGEYEFISKRNSSGAFTYSMGNGRIEMAKPFKNDTYDWDEVCVYGKNKSGDMVIHLETKYRLTQLKWIQESDRIAPSIIGRQKEIAKREAARYKHLTKPGEGIRADEIEKVIYTWDSPFRNGAKQMDFEGFLLLKDGRVRDGLPCAPDALDLPASRSREPDAWGWWKKVKNDKQNRYTFAWPVRPREYRMPNGNQLVGLPFEKGTRLSGDFGAVSTQIRAATNYSAVRWWGVRLSKNGRFLKYRHGSVQSGGIPGMDTMITTAWNDEKAATSLSGPIVGGTTQKLHNPALDRMGKYELDGYRLTLKFDSGRVEHLPTFTDKEESFLWFQGRAMRRK